MSKEKEGFKNIGPVSVEWLGAVGINNLDDLKQMGSVKTYLLAKEKGFNANVILLYALEGAIRDQPWFALSPDVKAQLRAEIDEI